MQPCRSVPSLFTGVIAGAGVDRRAELCCTRRQVLSSSGGAGATRRLPRPAVTKDVRTTRALSYTSWHIKVMAGTINSRPDEDALRTRTRDGSPVSRAVREALIGAASARAQQFLRAEAAALAADPADRDESAQVLRDMETLRSW